MPAMAGPSPTTHFDPGRSISKKALMFFSTATRPTYKKIGWEKSSPSWFDKLDNLMYYTNGSLQLKKYIKFLLSIQSKFNNPLTKDMTQINLPNHDNKIEYQIPNNGDMVLHLDIEKFKLN